MSTKDITNLLTSLERDAIAFRDTVDTRQPENYWVGDIQVRWDEDTAVPRVTMPGSHVSNHARLTLEQTAGKLEEKLRQAGSALAAYLPGHEVLYSYSAKSKKHTLTFDGQQVMQSVIKSWAAQLPLLKAVLGDLGTGTMWIFDTVQTPDRHRFGSDEMVFAPDLTNAILRHRFFGMSLTERKTPHLKKRAIYAAVRGAPHPAPNPVEMSLDLAAIEAAWKEMTSSLGQAWAWPTSPILAMTVNAGQSEFEMSHETHVMLTPEDDARQQVALRHARACLETFVQTVMRLAPHTNFNAQVQHGAHRASWYAQFLTTGDAVCDAHLVSQKIAESEKLGALPWNLYATGDGNYIDIRRARSPEEASALTNMTWQPPTVIPIVPVSLAEIALAEAEVDELWKERRALARSLA